MMGTDRVKDHFEEEALYFDEIILRLIPYYRSMIEALVRAIPFEKSLPLRVIDLGCGTGTVAAQVMQYFPHAQVTCVDLAENMIAAAQKNLERYPETSYIVADFHSFDFDSEYDVVVSSLALHHLSTNKLKYGFLKKIFENLHPGGAFYNADVVLAATESLQNVYMDAWRRYMNQRISLEEIENKWIPTYEKEDHPARLIDQLAWMTEIGFSDVDVIWKYYNFAVYGGIRP